MGLPDLVDIALNRILLEYENMGYKRIDIGAGASILIQRDRYILVKKRLEDDVNPPGFTISYFSSLTRLAESLTTNDVVRLLRYIIEKTQH